MTQLQDCSNPVAAPEKSNAQAMNFKNQGNDCFKMGKNQEAWSLYTKAIQYADPSSEFLPIYYGNRSAALFELLNYKECLLDIDRALELCSTLNLLRREKWLRRQSVAKRRLGLNLKSSKSSSLNSPRIEGFDQNAIRMTYDCSGRRGRMIEAERRIDAGFQIHSDLPLASALQSSIFTHNHCYRCFASVEFKAPLSCSGCAGVLYCSVDCLKSMPVCRHRPNTADPDWAYCGESSVLLQILSLYKPSIYSGSTSIPPETIETFWDLSSSKNPCQDIFKLKTFDLEQQGAALQRIRCNGFLIKQKIFTSNETSNSQVDCVTEQVLGFAVYLFSSAFNHSCDPNAVVSFDGNKIIITAARAIDEGEEITISYGPVAAKLSLHERQEWLREKFEFDCECRACLKGDNLPSSAVAQYQIAFKCPRFPVCSEPIPAGVNNCPGCNENVSRIAIIPFGSPDYWECCHPRSLELASHFDKIAEYCASRGNFHNALAPCRQSTLIIKAVYGSSPELAEECMKYCALLLRCHMDDVQGSRDGKVELVLWLTETHALYNRLGLAHTPDFAVLQDWRRLVGIDEG